MVWISASFGYYLIAYQLKYIRGDLYINYIISSISEIFAYLTSGIFIKFFGIKNTLLVSYIISLLGMLSIILIKTENKILISIFVLGGKFGVS
jgi:hypothetical protein